MMPIRAVAFLKMFVALAISAPAVTVAAPQKTTEQILERARTAPNARKVEARTATRSQKAVGFVNTVGDQPPGYGSFFEWNREDPQVDIVLFLNAADYLGIA